MWNPPSSPSTLKVNNILGRGALLCLTLPHLIREEEDTRYLKAYSAFSERVVQANSKAELGWAGQVSSLGSTGVA